MRQISKEQKEMQGTFEPSREVESVKLEEWDGQRMPSCPAGWDYPMQSFWNERCKDLKNAGYLARAVLEPLRRYCFAVKMARDAEAKVEEEGCTIEQIGTKGQVYTVKNPALDVLKDANKEIQYWSAHFGFTPLDVQKIPAVKKEEAKMNLLK